MILLILFSTDIFYILSKFKVKKFYFLSVIMKWRCSALIYTLLLEYKINNRDETRKNYSHFLDW